MHASDTRYVHARYSSVAIVLHWVMALAFILMLTSGFVLEYAELEKDFTFQLYQWHKSLGVLLLIAFVLRIGWRLFHKSPALPASMPKLEQWGAKLGHWALYFCMLAFPLSGWLMVSASVYGLPTIVFGVFEWPHLPGLAGNEVVSDAAKQVHGILAWVFPALILGHILAVVKHAVIDKENLLPRMWWTKGKQI